MTTGEQIKKLRKDRGLTQSELAKELGISRSYMSEIESDKRNMSINTVTKIANKLKVSPTNLIDPDSYHKMIGVYPSDLNSTELSDELLILRQKDSIQNKTNMIAYITNFLDSLTLENTDFSVNAIDLLSTLTKFIYINQSKPVNDDPTNLRFLNYIIDILNKSSLNDLSQSSDEIKDDLKDKISWLVDNIK